LRKGKKPGKQQGLNKITLDNNLLNDCNFRSKDNDNFFQKNIAVPKEIILR
jgi:hypothetical protein